MRSLKKFVTSVAVAGSLAAGAVVAAPPASASVAWFFGPEHHCMVAWDQTRTSVKIQSKDCHKTHRVTAVFARGRDVTVTVAPGKKYKLSSGIFSSFQRMKTVW